MRPFFVALVLSAMACSSPASAPPLKALAPNVTSVAGLNVTDYPNSATGIGCATLPFGGQVCGVPGGSVTVNGQIVSDGGLNVILGNQIAGNGPWYFSRQTVSSSVTLSAANGIYVGVIDAGLTLTLPSPAKFGAGPNALNTCFIIKDETGSGTTVQPQDGGTIDNSTGTKAVGDAGVLRVCSGSTSSAWWSE